MKAKRLRRWVAIPAVLALAMTACSSGEDSAPTTEVSDGSEATGDGSETDTPDEPDDNADGPVAGGDLVIATGGTATTLDPHRYRADPELIRLQQMYDTLVDYSLDDYSLEPRLAESWEISEDGLTVTLNLRPGVVFHDGSDLTAEDVVFSIDRARDPASDELAPLLTAIADVTAVDDGTVALTLSAPDRSILQGLVKVYIVQADPDADYDNAPNGTGPFMLQEWNRNENIVFVKNESYWADGLPYLDSVTFNVVPEANTQILQLTNGEIDMIAPSVSFSNVEGLQNEGMQLPVSEGGVYDLRLNTRVEPWSDVRVRQALSHAIDREAIQTALFGFSTIRSTIVPPEDELFNPDAMTFNEQDQDEARRLLQEAGYGDGEVTGTIMVHADLGPQYTLIAQLVAAAAAEVGITLEIESMDIGTWLERFYENMDFTIGHSAATFEPYAYAQVSEGWDQSDGASMGWIESQPDVRALMDEAPSIVDDAEYREALFEIQARGQEDQARIVLGGVLKGPALQPNIQGFTADPLSRLFLTSVWIDE